EQVGGSFQLLCFDQADKERDSNTIRVEHLALNTKNDSSGNLAQRYLGKQKEGYYLVRPDQHIAARWTKYDPTLIHQALQRASGQTAGVQWRN
ncbi:MAG: FAD-dependent oxidoreductase, partial [Deltaproteobacteria bacterium]